MTGDDDRFLERWSRRKRAKEDGEPAESPGPPPVELEEETDGDPEVVARLPDIESLDESSDFTAFMAEGVPEALRRRALRKLWRLNPIFANLDGLNDYDEDYTDAATVIAGLKTAYKVGRGMLDDRPEAEAETEETAAHGVEIAEEEASSEPVPETPEPIDETQVASTQVASTSEDPVAAALVPESTEREARKHAAARPRESGRSALRRRWGDPGA